MDRQLRVTDNVCEQYMGDFKLDLFLNFGGHLDLHGNVRRNDTLKQTDESRAQS
jgi:hypothetical protein